MKTKQQALIEFNQQIASASSKLISNTNFSGQEITAEVVECFGFLLSSIGQFFNSREHFERFLDEFKSDILANYDKVNNALETKGKVN